MSEWAKKFNPLRFNANNKVKGWQKMLTASSVFISVLLIFSILYGANIDSLTHFFSELQSILVHTNLLQTIKLYNTYLA